MLNRSDSIKTISSDCLILSTNLVRRHSSGTNSSGFSYFTPSLFTRSNPFLNVPVVVSFAFPVFHSYSNHTDSFTFLLTLFFLRFFKNVRPEEKDLRYPLCFWKSLIRKKKSSVRNGVRWSNVVLSSLREKK